MIAIYLRLSMADGDLGDNRKDESNSIENQRLLLQNYIMDHDDLAEDALTENPAQYPAARVDVQSSASQTADTHSSTSQAADMHSNINAHRSIGKDGNILNVLEYVDDGYSGTSFERPSFQRMIEDCQRGLVTTILVKDVSRFGRNYIGVGDYIDRLFPLLGVRFISANNNYDSSDYAGEPMGFDLEVNNLISTFYSRDLSKKIKSAKASRRKRGISTSAYAPFGYMKDPEHKGKFMVDPEAAKTVRLIFRLACEDRKPTQIADELNRREILTPGMYNKEKHLWPATIKAKETEQLWTSVKVSKILKRYEYTGALVEGRRETIKLGSHHVRQKDKKDWVIIDNVNPAIVSKEDYEIAGGVLRTHKPPEYIIRRNYALKGKVKCGNCGRRMVYDDGGYEKTYSCRYGIATGKYSQCSKERVPAMKIEGTVRYAVWNLCRVILDVKEKADQSGTQEKDRFNGTAEIDRQMKLAKEERMQKYELYANGGMDREEYLRVKKELTEQIVRLEAEKQRLEAETAIKAQADAERMEFEGLCDRAEAYLAEDDLSAEMVEDMVREVRVF